MGDTQPLTEVGLTAPTTDQTHVLQDILSTLQNLQQSHRALAASVDLIEGRVNTLASVGHIHDAARQPSQGLDRKTHNSPTSIGSHLQGSPALIPLELTSSPKSAPADKLADEIPHSAKRSPAALGSHPTHTGAATSSKIILSTYPHQSGIDPIIMNWGDIDPMQRGPVVVSRAPSTIRRRNGKCIPFDITIWRAYLTLCYVSNWCTWRLLCHLSCFGSCQQEPRCRSQA